MFDAVKISNGRICWETVGVRCVFRASAMARTSVSPSTMPPLPEVSVLGKHFLPLRLSDIVDPYLHICEIKVKMRDFR
jgi:hypothetical protein